MSDLTTEEHTETHADKVKYYRKLNGAEVADINEIKRRATELMEFLDEVAQRMDTNENGHDRPIDRRWLARSKTAVQDCSMFGVRAVSQPEGA